MQCRLQLHNELANSGARDEDTPRMLGTPGNPDEPIIVGLFYESLFLLHKGKSIEWWCDCYIGVVRSRGADLGWRHGGWKNGEQAPCTRRRPWCPWIASSVRPQRRVARCFSKFIQGKLKR